MRGESGRPGGGPVGRVCEAVPERSISDFGSSGAESEQTRHISKRAGLSSGQWRQVGPASHSYHLP